MIWPQKSADILMVDDDAQNAELALTALRERNLSHHLFRVVDGYAALDFIAYLGIIAGGNGLTLPKVILLNLQLQSGNSIEILEQLKHNERTCQIPVVVITGSLDGVGLMVSYRMGVNSCVLKPARPEKFKQVIGDIGHYWMNINQLAL